MRNRPKAIVAIILATMVVAVAVRMGVAFPGEAHTDTPLPAIASDLSQAVVSPTIVLATPRQALPARGFGDVPEGAKLLLVGGVLFGLAAVIRRQGPG
jgi:hypothetical protein